MFGLFKKKPPSRQPDPDHVYVTDAERADGLAARCRGVVAGGARVVLVSPFRGHLARRRDELQGRGLPVELLAGGYRSGAAEPGAVPLLEHASFVHAAAQLAEGQPLEVFQIERHPLREHDLAVAAALPEGSRLHVFLSMDDGIFRIFGSSIQDLCRRLDLPPGEPIEHPLVARSIESAQEKLRQKVRTESPAETFDDWRQRNLGATR